MGQVNTSFFDQEFDNSQSRISIAKYSADEVIKQFLALYDCMDFKGELKELGIGRFQFFRRRKALRELKALCIALWGLALQKSFPDDACSFFTKFRETAPDLNGPGPDPGRLHNRVNAYIDLLNSKKDTDFLPVANYLAEALALDQRDMARRRLKLSLNIRNIYMLIFNKLV